MGGRRPHGVLLLLALLTVPTHWTLALTCPQYKKTLCKKDGHSKRLVIIYNNRKIECDGLVTISDVVQRPNMSYMGALDKYLLVIIDPDYPHPCHSGVYSGESWLVMASKMIPPDEDEDALESIKDYMEYKVPPIHSGIHRLQFYLYYPFQDPEEEPLITSRHDFSLEEFISVFGFIAPKAVKQVKVQGDYGL